MFDEFSEPQNLSCRPKLFLDCIVWSNGGLRLIGTEQIPGVEAREVLQSAEELITTDYNITSAFGSCIGFMRSGATARFAL